MKATGETAQQIKATATWRELCANNAVLWEATSEESGPFGGKAHFKILVHNNHVGSIVQNGNLVTKPWSLYATQDNSEKPYLFLRGNFEDRPTALAAFGHYDAARLRYAELHYAKNGIPAEEGHFLL